MKRAFCWAEVCVAFAFIVACSGNSVNPIPASPKFIGSSVITANAAAGAAAHQHAFKEFSIPYLPGRTTLPTEITVGVDAALWFTEGVGRIGRITTNGTIAQYGGQLGNPLGIAAGPDGALWFTEQAGEKIGRITTAGAITEYTIPTPNGQPEGITLGPDGAMWFTVPAIGGSYIGRITTSGAMTEYPIPGAVTFPAGIIAGPDRALWFTNATSIGKITTNGVVTEIPTPGCDSFLLGGIALGFDKNDIWYTDVGTNAIGRLSNGKITLYAIPTNPSSPRDIVAGRHVMWFVEAVGKIGRITRYGEIAEFTIPTFDSQPNGIAFYRNRVWFTETEGNKIGSFVLRSKQ